MYLTLESIITIGGAVTAIGAIVALFWRLFTWVNHQKEQDLKIAAIQEEQTLHTYGVLACLKGLHEMGCNGPVTDAINSIEKHLNKTAHDQK